ncbi:hypothetical protein JOF48_000703 [Arthrobacter stackebrandtii]|uniref:DUF3027 domain-containing protein n=1 Tax=Arthrobacter stackebrandtii TaxID=272161 RepID=A0ABS4YT35_9MICC|nr:DUF3027 domain-containing protein [Arthrobacter stackebrandtii]MBP2411904.1 hypothetical protein [Arthrobacter stackebrandtii]PYG99135.1 DUF3027 domain-containing protein [Arthrobacter stackebrandtii]
MTELPGDSAAPASESAAPRPGVPVWRVGKPDAFLAADVATARNAILSIAADAEIGAHLGARSEGVRCVTHLFESKKDGYRGWTWFASLARVSRGKESTVNEVGMLPTEDSVLAPQWVPWAERVRPEDQAAAEAEAAAHAEQRHDDGEHSATGDGDVTDAGHDHDGDGHDAADDATEADGEN